MTAAPLRAALLPLQPGGELRRVPAVSGLLLAGLSIAVLVGWLARVDVLTSVVPGLVPMRPLTALSLLVVGALLLLSTPGADGAASRPVRATSVVLAVAVTSLGLATIVQEVTGTEWGYESFFEVEGTLSTGQPLLAQDHLEHVSRPPVATAVCLLLLGLAFLVLLGGRVAAAQWLALLAMIGSLVTTLAYAFGVDEVYRITHYTSMAVHTSVAIVLAGFGILHLRPDRGFMPLAVSEGPGGAVIRRVLPVIVVVPTLVGLTSQVGVEEGWFGPRFAMAATLGVVCVGGGVLVWRQAAALARTDNRLVDATSALERVQRAEADREQAMQRLEIANDDLERFAAIAAHDLRAPLTTIRGYAELLGDRAGVSDDAHSLDLARRIERLVGRGTELIDDLLAYSRSGLDSEAALEPTPLDALVQQVAREVEDSADRPATITVEPLGSVAGDLVQLRQLFGNLLANAVKYCPDDREPVVVVDALPVARGTVTIRVTDNGLGIPEDERQRLFAIFQRGRRTTEIAGSGVGLAICERIVGRHGGRIWVEDGPEGGSRFCFTLSPAAGA